MMATEKDVSEKEDVFSMELLEEYTKSLREVKEGAILSGKILKITDSFVIVDVGYKSEGLIPVTEFRDLSRYKEGDEVKVLVDEVEDQEGTIVLSKQKADKIINWDKIVRSYKDGLSIKGKVYKRVKGGFMADVGMDAFLPMSQVDLRAVSDPDAVVGQEYEFKVVKIDEFRKNVVVSRKVLLEELRRKKREEMLSTLKVGEIRKGVVKNITDYGAFIDLGGVDGLLHISDMTWGRISHPSEILAIGDEIEVMILAVDKEKQKVSLGLKQIVPDPWLDVDKKYPVGAKVKGRIVNMVPYGVFVELEKGVEGLIHISEFSWTKKISHPSEMVAVGDIVEVVVLSIDKDAKKISLGFKQLEPNPWEKVKEKYPVGSKIRGKVKHLTNYGAFVELEEGIEGLIHISDMSWTRRIENPAEILKKGDIVEVVVLNIDPDRQRIALGIKQLEPDPWEGVEERYPIGKEVTGRITRIVPFGCLVELEPGVEGFIHSNQIKEFSNTGKLVQLKEDDIVKCVVLNVSQQNRRIALTLKEKVTREGEENETPPDSQG